MNEINCRYVDVVYFHYKTNQQIGFQDAGSTGPYINKNVKFTSPVMGSAGVRSTRGLIVSFDEVEPTEPRPGVVRRRFHALVRPMIDAPRIAKTRPRHFANDPFNT